VIENPYGLDALWKTGDFVAKGTLIIMVIMSMGSWYILITKIIDQVKLSGQAKKLANSGKPLPSKPVPLHSKKAAHSASSLNPALKPANTTKVPCWNKSI
jgi:biopolymer transport protein ExbB/TolQ